MTSTTNSAAADNATPDPGPRALSASERLSGPVVRYLLVSVVNVIIHFSTLQAALSLWGWPGEWANAFAAVVAGVPAFLLSRYWVWEVEGRAELMNEVVPFAVIAVIGMVVSSAFAGIADRLSDNHWTVLIASFVGYFVVWVGKFLALNVMFRRSKARIAAEAS